MIPFDRDAGSGNGSSGSGSSGSGSSGSGSSGERARGEWGGRLRGFTDDAARERVRDFPERRAEGGRRAPRGQRGGWLVPPLMLSAIAAGVLFVLRGPDEVFGVCFGIVLALGIGWILVCALLPGKADRACPSCGGEGLERLDPDTTRGLRCGLCGWEDETASSFLLAEEEGPLEDIVLRERRGGPRRW